MKQLSCRIILAAALLSVASCQAKPPQDESASPAFAAAAKKFEKVREPAVAGIFYPRDENVLKRDIERVLAKADPKPLEEPLRPGLPSRRLRIFRPDRGLQLV